jgi:2-oxoglutarate/2-oxoacid ferredoxin oxidoreductase subunit beta
MDYTTQNQELISKASEYSQFESPTKHTWCSGCGNYGIISALKRSLTLENIKPHEVLLCYDVGCSGNESDKINCNTIHGLHGRVLPLASGASIANSSVPVIAMAGDGATLSEGINHLVHTIRNNYNITFILHNNSIYGLTIGQASSTTHTGEQAFGTVGGVSVPELNVMDFVLSCNPTFVARSFASDVEHLTEVIRAGMNHQGFSFIEVYQACPTFNKATPQQWYWDKLVNVQELEGYDNTDIWAARKIVQNTTDKLAVGIIFHENSDQNRKDFLTTQKLKTPILNLPLYRDESVPDISEILKTFAL